MVISLCVASFTVLHYFLPLWLFNFQGLEQFLEFPLVYKNGVPRLDNWPILDLHRQVGHLRTCYTSMRDELADLFTRQKKFFVEKNVDVDELKDWFGYQLALQGVLNLANKLIGDEDNVL
uniref:Uncharacterized protein n=1 Tax=Meloidogyne javanica TaxID=6303 RepID=A0A915LIV8_MELJA